MLTLLQRSPGSSGCDKVVQNLRGTEWPGPVWSATGGRVVRFGYPREISTGRERRTRRIGGEVPRVEVQERSFHCSTRLTPHRLIQSLNRIPRNLLTAR